MGKGMKKFMREVSKCNAVDFRFLAAIRTEISAERGSAVFTGRVVCHREGLIENPNFSLQKQYFCPN